MLVVKGLHVSLHLLYFIITHRKGSFDGFHESCFSTECDAIDPIFQLGVSDLREFQYGNGPNGHTLRKGMRHGEVGSRHTDKKVCSAQPLKPIEPWDANLPFQPKNDLTRWSVLEVGLNHVRDLVAKGLLKDPNQCISGNFPESPGKKWMPVKNARTAAEHDFVAALGTPA